MGSTAKRSLAKALTYRFISSMGIFIVVSLYSGSAKVGGMFALTEALCKSGVYFLHERLWKKIKWGKI